MPIKTFGMSATTTSGKAHINIPTSATAGDATCDAWVENLIKGNQVELDAVLSAIKNGGLFVPRTVEALVSNLDESTKDWIKASILDDNGVDTIKTDAKLINALKTGALPKKLAGSGTVSLPASGTLDINPTNGLNLLLANPALLQVVLEQRKKQTAAAYARVTSMPGMLIPGIGMPIKGMFMGGNVDQLDPNVPIEMRGGGYKLAAMRGGALVLGTSGLPTMWRPVDDKSFISSGLKSAYANLKASLAAKGVNLATDTSDKVTNLIGELEKAENNIKEHRDKLNNFNKALSSNMVELAGKTTVNDSEIAATADAYNTAMSQRQKLEGKFFKVIIALNGKLHELS